MSTLEEAYKKRLSDIGQYKIDLAVYESKMQGFRNEVLDFVNLLDEDSIKLIRELDPSFQIESERINDNEYLREVHANLSNLKLLLEEYGLKLLEG